MRAYEERILFCSIKLVVSSSLHSCIFREQYLTIFTPTLSLLYNMIFSSLSNVNAIHSPFTCAQSVPKSSLWAQQPTATVKGHNFTQNRIANNIYADSRSLSQSGVRIAINFPHATTNYHKISTIWINVFDVQAHCCYAPIGKWIEQLPALNVRPYKWNFLFVHPCTLSVAFFCHVSEQVGEYARTPS